MRYCACLILTLAITSLVASDLESGGANRWLIHTPDDGRQDLYFGHWTGNAWEWPFAMRGDGYLWMKPGATLASGGRLHISGEEHLYLLNKTGVSVSKAWGGNGNLHVEGTTHCGDIAVHAGKNIWGQGRLHISGQEALYLLNKAGVIIGKEWGGNGDLYVQGHLTVNEPARFNSILRAEAMVTGDLLVKAQWWADSVFADGYELMPLEEVETFIDDNGHLPGVPSEAEVKAQGLQVNDMLATQMAKIEELTLHAIALEKQVRDQDAVNAAQAATIAGQTATMAELEAIVAKQQVVIERCERLLTTFVK